MINLITTSISSGFDSAVNTVIATNVSFEIIIFPDFTNALFLFKNSKNNVAAILLHPSTNG